MTRYLPHHMERPTTGRSFNGSFTERMMRDGYEGRIPTTRSGVQAMRDRAAMMLERDRMREAAHRCDEGVIR